MGRRTRGLAIADLIAGILVLITIIGLLGGVYFHKQREKTMAKEGREIHITARQWVFEPNEIVIKKGQEVTLVITSADVTHGFMIEALGINKIINPGKPVKIKLKIDKPGTYEFRCSVYCGEPWPGSGMGHWFMRGTIKVVEG